MTTISLADPVNGTLTDANLIASNNNLLEAAINGNLDNSNIVAGAAIDGTKLADSTVTNAKLVSSGGLLSSMPPGRELTYNEVTSNVSITQGSEAAATTIVTATAFTFDGTTPVLIEFFCPSESTASSDTVTLVLYDGASSIGKLSQFTVGGSTIGPVYTKSRITPSAASHTYSIRGYRTTNTGTMTCGAGGVGNFMPGYIRIFKA